MILLQMLKFVVLYSFFKLFVMCEYMSASDDEAGFNEVDEVADEENSVLDSVYDTMKHNYEIKLRQNWDKLNFIRDIRSKRNVNEPMNMNPMPMNPINMNTADYYKNHQWEVNRKHPVNFPLGFKNSPPRLLPITSPTNPLQHRSDYEYEEYHKCHDVKPSVQTFHISDHDQEKHHQLPGISTVLLTGLKYLFGGFAILALPFIVLKALFLPLKLFLFLKAFAIIKSFLFLTIFLRLLRFNRRFGLNGANNNNNNNNFLGLPGLKNKQKLQTIKDILNSEDFTEEDIDYKSDDEDVISKESSHGTPMYLDSPYNNTEVPEEFVQNLVKLIKLKNKKW